MKHIKTYKIFESSENDEVKQYLEDIFLELEDEGFDVGIVRWERFKVIISKFSTDGTSILERFKLKDVYDSIQMARSYMLDKGFFINELKGVLTNKYGQTEVVDSLLSSCNLYEEGKGELFDKPIHYLEFKFNKSK